MPTLKEDILHFNEWLVQQDITMSREDTSWVAPDDLERLVDTWIQKEARP